MIREQSVVLKKRKRKSSLTKKDDSRRTLDEIDENNNQICEVEPEWKGRKIKEYEPEWKRRKLDEESGKKRFGTEATEREYRSGEIEGFVSHSDNIPFPETLDKARSTLHNLDSNEIHHQEPLTDQHSPVQALTNELRSVSFIPKPPPENTIAHPNYPNPPPSWKNTPSETTMLRNTNIIPPIPTTPPSSTMSSTGFNSIRRDVDSTENLSEECSIPVDQMFPLGLNNLQRINPIISTSNLEVEFPVDLDILSKIFPIIVTQLLGSFENENDVESYLKKVGSFRLGEGLNQLELTFRALDLIVTCLRRNEVYGASKRKPDRYDGPTFSEYCRRRTGKYGIFLNNAQSQIDYAIDMCLSLILGDNGLKPKKSERNGLSIPNVKDELRQFLNILMRYFHPSVLFEEYGVGMERVYVENFDQVFRQLDFLCNLRVGERRGKEETGRRKKMEKNDNIGGGKRRGMSASEIKANVMVFRILYLPSWMIGSKLLVDTGRRMDLNKKNQLDFNLLEDILKGNENRRKLEVLKSIGRSEIELLLRGLFGYRVCGRNRMLRERERAELKRFVDLIFS